MTITLTREEAQQLLYYMDDGGDYTDEYGKLIETLRARLAQPEPEPVAWYYTGSDVEWRSVALDVDLDDAQKANCIPLYTAPPQREWQGLTDEEMSAAMDYWSDPVRSAYGGAHSADGEYVGMIDTWQYIEAKLKEKNT